MRVLSTLPIFGPLRRLGALVLKSLQPTMPGGADVVRHFRGKKGIEIGGPSTIFRHFIPVYRVVERVDGVNFASRTVWHAEQAEGKTYNYYPGREKGWQFICEGTDLSTVDSDRYDFVLSSHSLEHIANPVRALREWIRVIKPGGLLLLVLPHQERTFDHRRPTTALQHMIDDFQNDIGESDLTHLAEIMDLHDLSRDPAAGTADAFRSRSLNNYANRCLHHHVFCLGTALELVDYVGLEILKAVTAEPFHIIVLARKTPSREEPCIPTH